MIKKALLHTALGIAGSLFISTAMAADFQLSSPSIKPNSTLTADQVFNGFGCTGKNISPELVWSNAPAGTKSFALTVYDPDAPTGSGWWHWVVYNLPPTSGGLPAGAGGSDGTGLPAGTVQGRTDYGVPGFGGACPPVGNKPHRYQLTLYALDIARLPVAADASAAMVGFFLNAHALGKASLTWHYGR